MAKIDVVNEAVEAGLGTFEELESHTVAELKQMMADADEGIQDVIVSRQTEPKKQCLHEYRHVRVIAHPNNYVCDRCWKCGDEINYEN
jgi:hypothetical protein